MMAWVSRHPHHRGRLCQPNQHEWQRRQWWLRRQSSRICQTLRARWIWQLKRRLTWLLSWTRQHNPTTTLHWSKQISSAFHSQLFSSSSVLHLASALGGVWRGERAVTVWVNGLTDHHRLLYLSYVYCQCSLREREWQGKEEKWGREENRQNTWENIPLLLLPLFRVGFVSCIVVFNEQRVEKVDQQQNWHGCNDHFVWLVTCGYSKLT